MIAQIAVTASVAFTGLSPNGGKLLRAVLRFGRIEPDRGRQHALQAFVRHRLRLAAPERVIHLRAKRRHGVADRVLGDNSAHSAGTATGCCAGAFLPDFAGGTSSPNSFAALKPRMLRLACSSRNGSLVIELGASKSQCGQSDA